MAQRMQQRCTVEQFAVALAQHFVLTYPLVGQYFVLTYPLVAGCACMCAWIFNPRASPPHPTQVTKAKVSVEQKPWNRAEVDGLQHDHGKG